MTLTVGGLLNKKKTAIVSGPGPPDLIHVCRCRAITGISVRGWVGVGTSSLQTVRAQVWPGRSKLFETLTVFLIFFHRHFLETKAPIRPVVRRLVWAFVVPIYQRRISRDKVHTIFKNSKLNVKIYTRIYPRR